MSTKQEIRERVWERLEKENLARFPRPVRGRIPNFVGAEKAAQLLAELPEFIRSKTVKVNPDSPQLKIRELALRAGKLLLIPAPRLRSGFLMVKPEEVKGRERSAASIGGAFKIGQEITLDKLPRPDLLIVGSVAVSKEGSRIGKGEGYSEIEYGILRELNLVDETIPIATTVHPVQIVKEVPQDPYDVAVDYIVTPEKAASTHRTRRRPSGIFWERVSEDMFQQMPILRDLRTRGRNRN